MTAGTVVITGGILATVILLCIVAVLCYCRLQYYCCKRNESEVDVGSVVGGGESQPHFACNACSAPGVDGPAVTPLSLVPVEGSPPHSYCPTCSPYYLRSGLTDEMRNGGERLGFHTYHYENPGVCLPLSVTPQGPSPLSYYSPVDMYPLNTRPYSTQV